MFSRSRAFTLIELLIVVAIIAILAAIAVPNFLEAQTRSRVSRVQTDLRTVATALESYKIDWNRYPADWVVNLVFGVTEGMGTRLNSEGYLPPRLSSPVAYLATASLKDTFVPPGFEGTQGFTPAELYWPVTNYFYQSVEHSMRAVGHPAFPGTTVVAEYQAQRPMAGWQAAKQGAGWAARDWHLNYGLWKVGSMGPNRRYNGGDNIYDPTNGTISSGDIYRTQRDPIGSTMN